MAMTKAAMMVKINRCIFCCPPGTLLAAHLPEQLLDDDLLVEGVLDALIS